ncbi:MAG TPA: hypothetical protein VHS03_16195 [Gaiellaceae bacterium]|nr:hypothetical protein [Gaiellaceae bacterium]
MRLPSLVLARAGIFVVARVSEGAATAGILVASIVVPLTILGVVSWFFWRSSNRDRRQNPHQ